MAPTAVPDMTSCRNSPNRPPPRQMLLCAARAMISAMTRLLLAALAALMVHGAGAQSYPSRPVKIVVPATPGGAIELIARTLCEKMTGSFWQPVLVENKPAAADNLGTHFAAKESPDAY